LTPQSREGGQVQGVRGLGERPVENLKSELRLISSVAEKPTVGLPLPFMKPRKGGGGEKTKRRSGRIIRGKGIFPSDAIGKPAPKIIANGITDMMKVLSRKKTACQPEERRKVNCP